MARTRDPVRPPADVQAHSSALLLKEAGRGLRYGTQDIDATPSKKVPSMLTGCAPARPMGMDWRLKWQARLAFAHAALVVR